jgi:hypothetical protein
LKVNLDGFVKSRNFSNFVILAPYLDAGQE